MASIMSIEAGKYNKFLAKALKEEEEFKAPEWVEFVKSGVGKQRPIEDKEFWEKRAASILRQIYINEVVGVQRLRTRYGNKKNRGGKPSKFKRGSGKIIRVILQQAEEAGFVEKSEGVKKGRKLTAKGKTFMESVNVSSGEDSK